MAGNPPPSPPFLLVLAWIVTLWALATPAFPANDIYKYVDDEGVQHFTDQWQLIPEQYRSRIQEVDPSTGKPFKPGSARPEPAPSQGAPAPMSVRKEPPPPPTQQEPPFYAAWLEKFSQLSIPLPSQIQLGVGLMGVMVILGALKIIRVSPNPFVKLMLKGVIMVVLLGSAYTLYMASLSDRISEATRDPGPQTTTGKDAIKAIQETTERAKEVIKEKAKAPLEKVKDATVGDAIRAHDSMNQSNLEKEKILNKIESGP